MSAGCHGITPVSKRGSWGGGDPCELSPQLFMALSLRKNIVHYRSRHNSPSREGQSMAMGLAQDPRQLWRWCREIQSWKLFIILLHAASSSLEQQFIMERNKNFWAAPYHTPESVNEPAKAAFIRVEGTPMHYVSSTSSLTLPARKGAIHFQACWYIQ